MNDLEFLPCLTMTDDEMVELMELMDSLTSHGDEWLLWMMFIEMGIA
jgi:hypothetical protein